MAHRETLIEKLTREIGWLVTNREGDYHEIRADDCSEFRYVHVRCRDDSDFVRLWTNFPVRFPLAAMTAELTLALLRRNQALHFGKWGIDVVGSLELRPNLDYLAIKAGLTPGRFREICQELVNERQTVHDALRRQVGDIHHLATPTRQKVSGHEPFGNTLGAGGTAGQITWLGE